MDENTNRPETFEAPSVLPEPKKKLSFDNKDRLLLIFVLILGYIFEELARGAFSVNVPAIGAFIAAGLAVGLTLWYAGEKRPLDKKYLPILIAALLTALSLGLYPFSQMTMMNWLAAPALLFIWALCACGIVGENGRWTMLVKSFLMSWGIRWKHIDKPFRALGSMFKRKSLTWVWVLVGLGVGLLLISFVIVPLLRSADGVFSAVTDDLMSGLLHGGWVNYIWRILGAACIGALIYSALYSLRRDGEWKPGNGGEIKPAVPAALPLTVLALVDAVYLAFVAIQFAYLFGGAEHLKLTGLSYAEYARSGFFELVFVAVLNLTLSMLSAVLTKHEGKSAAALKALSSALLVMTAVILASAAFRMYMYVSVYGLSVLRALTIWGMALIAIWLAGAFIKLFRPKTKFFRILFVSSIAAWAILSLCNVNGIIAGYNVRGYMSGSIENVDVVYMNGLGSAALPALYELRDSGYEDGKEKMPYERLSNVITELENQADSACGDWRSWNLEAAVLCGKAE